MGARDSGWIHIFCENAQEVYDSTIQAVRIAEHPDVQLPVSVNLDGFIISHEVANVSVDEDAKVREFIGEFRPRASLLDLNKPITVGPVDLQDYYFEHRRQIADGMVKSFDVIRDVAREFGEKFGRNYGFVEGYGLEGAEAAIVGLGSTMGTLRDIVDNAARAGKKVGLLKIRLFRPFPAEAILSALKNVKAIAVLDRADSINAMGGPLFGDMRSILHGNSAALVKNYIYGLGGREAPEAELNSVIDDLLEMVRTREVKEELTYLGVRE